MEVGILLANHMVEYVFWIKKDVNLNRFIMIAKINEAKALTKHVWCDCNCKLDGKRSGVILGQNCMQLSDAASRIYFFQKFVLSKAE